MGWWVFEKWVSPSHCHTSMERACWNACTKEENRKKNKLDKNNMQYVPKAPELHMVSGPPGWSNTTGPCARGSPAKPKTNRRPTRMFAFTKLLASSGAHPVALAQRFIEQGKSTEAPLRLGVFRTPFWHSTTTSLNPPQVRGRRA